VPRAGRPETTIYDVADHAGVSAATVSRVLNGKGSVDPRLCDRVRASAEHLGYRRNLVARNLRRQQSTLWAVVVSDVRNPFFTSVVRGIEDVAQDAGYSVVLCNSDESAEKEAAYVVAALSEQVAGVILSPTSGADTVRTLAAAGTPVVLIDRELRGVRSDAVLVDNRHGARLATEHLLEMGYSRIGCITGPRTTSTAAQRLRGYRAALQAVGPDAGPHDDLVRYGDFRRSSGVAAMTALLDLQDPPDAVFVANNLMTIGALEAIASRGLVPPEDIGVVGFDTIPWADLVTPSLTTVSQPTYELGREAAGLLLGRIEDPRRPVRRRVLRTTLHVRASSAPARA